MQNTSTQELISHLQQFKWNKQNLSGTSLCPFHKDTNPSFGISFSLNSYHCFSCGVSGNLNKLCEHFNIDRLFTAKSKKKVLKGILKKDYKPEPLSSVYNIIKYKKDAILDPTLNTNFAYNHPYLNLRIMEDYLKDKFYIRYDPESESIIFPIFDMQQNIIANYRRFNEKKSKLKIKGRFSKGFQISNHLYNLNNYSGQKTILITEGIIDCITTYDNLKQLNLLNFIHPVSCYSVTNLNKKHLRMLKKLGIENIILFFDNDNPGLIGIEDFKKKVYNKKNNKFLSIYTPKFELYPNKIKDPDGLMANEALLILKDLNTL